MTEPTNDNLTTQEGATPGGPDDGSRRVLGGDPERMDAAPGSGGLAGAGADGETGAREQLRQDLGERPSEAGGSVQGSGSQS